MAPPRHRWWQPGDRRRLVVAAVVALVGALGTASCGRPVPPPAQAIPAAGSRTLQEGSSRLSVAVESDGGWSLAAAGVVDHRARRGELTLDDVAPLGLPATAGPATVVLDGDTQFVRLPERPGAPRRPRWVAVNVDRARAEGVDVSRLRRLQRLDPLPVFTLLQGADSRAARAGNERVSGTETTRYTATVEIRAAAEKLPPPQRAYFTAAMAPVGAAVALEIWVDGAGRVRRIRYSGPATPAETQGSAEPGTAASEQVVEGTTTTFELSDFGAVPTATAPPADAVLDVAEFLRGASGP